MAEAQLKTWRALGTDMLLTCSDPAREVIDLAGEESVRWFDDQPPAIDEENAALKEKSRLKTFRLPELSSQYAAVQVEAGADSVGMSDAAASMIGQGFYMKHLWPRQKQILSAVCDAGAMARLHMCGCTDSLLEGMAALPVDVYEIDFKTDLAKARQTLGRDAVICGNIDTLDVMLYGDTERVWVAAKACHRICGDRYIVAPGCETAPLTPVENVKALVDYAARARSE